jgi:hypothetical protein
MKALTFGEPNGPISLITANMSRLRNWKAGFGYPLSFLGTHSPDSRSETVLGVEFRLKSLEPLKICLFILNGRLSLTLQSTAEFAEEYHDT